MVERVGALWHVAIKNTMMVKLSGHQTLSACRPTSWNRFLEGELQGGSRPLLESLDGHRNGLLS